MDCEVRVGEVFLTFQDSGGIPVEISNWEQGNSDFQCSNGKPGCCLCQDYNPALNSAAFILVKIKNLSKYESQLNCLKLFPTPTRYQIITLIHNLLLLCYFVPRLINL